MRYYDYYVEKAKRWGCKIKKHYRSHNTKIKIMGCKALHNATHVSYILQNSFAFASALIFRV